MSSFAATGAMARSQSDTAQRKRNIRHYQSRPRTTTPSSSPPFNFLHRPLPLLPHHTSFNAEQKSLLQYHCVILLIIAHCLSDTTATLLSSFLGVFLTITLTTLKHWWYIYILKKRKIKLHNELMLTHEWVTSP